MACQSSDLGNEREVNETVNEMNAVDSLLGPWTPNSIEPPSTLLTVRPHSSEPTNMTANTAVPDTYYDTSRTSITGTDQWIHVASEVASIPSTEAPFEAGAAYLQQTWDTMDFLNDLVPSADFGNWLEDPNEFSISHMYDIWPQTSTAFDIDLDPSMDSAIDMMKDQLQRRSRASSPSREAQRWSWYSALPQLGVYDEDLINVLLNVSRRHISSTFAIFVDFEVGPGTRVELCLAMAAVGGLYCTCPDSNKIAKMLFNDARRLMLQDYLQYRQNSFEDYLSFAKTFILLEVYGLCSGDKRAYEFMEVFHGSKVHAATSCIKSLPTEAGMKQQNETRLLSEAMHVLDSYRVLLLQRPPSFVDDLESPLLQSQSSDPDSADANSAASSDGDMYHLASCIRYSWMASPRDADGCALPRLWKAEFVQLALDRWMQSNSYPSGQCPLEPSQMLLYHLAHVSLQSNMAVLHRLAQQAAAGSTSTLPTNQAQNDGIRPWTSNRQCAIALWHSKAILRIAQEGKTAPQRKASTSVNRDKTQVAEPPHLPLCVYFATLVVWFGETKSGGDNASSASDLVDAGSQLLFKLRVPMAKFLGTALCDLISSEIKTRHGAEPEAGDMMDVIS
ncbi:hypothetical protein BR93DRAFT_964228 [Coniochaeta sp. PMI_546]|nr:hypothetical protein BR93DRAFT_964228 [Coniochaeta sp. PMI_546]